MDETKMIADDFLKFLHTCWETFKTVSSADSCNYSYHTSISNLFKVHQQFFVVQNRTLGFTYQLKTAAGKSHSCKSKHAFYRNYRQRRSFTRPVKNCQNVLSPISRNHNRLRSNWWCMNCPTWGHIERVQWRDPNLGDIHMGGKEMEMVSKFALYA